MLKVLARCVRNEKELTQPETWPENVALPTPHFRLLLPTSSSFINPPRRQYTDLTWARSSALSVGGLSLINKGLFLGQISFAAVSTIMLSSRLDSKLEIVSF